MGGILNGMALHRGDASVRGHLPHLLGLHAPVDPAGGAHAPARHICVYARQHRRGRGRPDPSAHRASGFPARHPGRARPAPRGRARDGRGVARGARVHPRAELPRAHPPSGGDHRPRRGVSRDRPAPRRLHPARSGRRPRSDPHRERLRGGRSGAGAGGASGGRRADPRGLAPQLVALLPPAAGATGTRCFPPAITARVSAEAGTTAELDPLDRRPGAPRSASTTSGHRPRARCCSRSSGSRRRRSSPRRGRWRGCRRWRPGSRGSTLPAGSSTKQDSGCICSPFCGAWQSIRACATKAFVLLERVQSCFSTRVQSWFCNTPRGLDKPSQLCSRDRRRPSFPQICQPASSFAASVAQLPLAGALLQLTDREPATPR